MPNFAALRAAVFQLSTKNLRGADIRPPPVGARVNVPRHELVKARTWYSWLVQNSTVDERELGRLLSLRLVCRFGRWSRVASPTVPNIRINQRQGHGRRPRSSKT